ncbi:MAG: O-sialoglycoprotein endopeptidase [Alicyclobacillaceae bacterium]|nr:O-sialoglycoprotein endopeptidase [Alicyclobacillaceae bacterium]
MDTSNYTTSICVVDEEGKVVYDGRRPLAVERGERGLRQSEALFQHLHHLPELMENLAESGVDFRKIAAVAASGRPRPKEGSYMPVFVPGLALGRSLAAALGVPFVSVSHQEGHLAAAETDVGGIEADSFLAVHISGGTTDVLAVHRRPGGYQVEVLGESLDLHAGQFIDRVGVALGLSFPAGPALERLAQEAESGAVERVSALPVSVRGCSISFSGPQAEALRRVERGMPPAEIALAVQRCVAKALEKALLHAFSQRNERQVLLVGGVAANRWIRARLIQRLEHPAVGARLYFASPDYSRDNARGVAWLALKTAGIRA